MSKMTYVTYVCSNCGEKDTGKFFPGEVAFIAINCWNCHAGQGLTIGEMSIQSKGMFPERSERRAT